MATYCPKCKAENPDESKFCNECGTQITVSEEIPDPTETLETVKEELTTGSTFADRYQIIEELGKMVRYEESLTELKKALELDPLSLIINQNLGDYFYESRQYDKAIEQYQKTKGLNPQFKFINLGLGKSYLQKEMFEEAIQELQFSPGGELVYAYVAVGKRGKALEVLEELEKKAEQQISSPMILARAYLGLGEIDETFDCLNKAYEERWPQLVNSIFIDPYFNDLHSDPRFDALLNKLG